MYTLFIYLGNCQLRALPLTQPCVRSKAVVLAENFSVRGAYGCFVFFFCHRDLWPTTGLLKKQLFPNFRSYKQTQWRPLFDHVFVHFIIVLTSNTFNQSSALFGTSGKTFVVACSEVCAYLDHNSPLTAKLNLPQI